MTSTVNIQYVQNRCVHVYTECNYVHCTVCTQSLRSIKNVDEQIYRFSVSINLWIIHKSIFINQWIFCKIFIFINLWIFRKIYIFINLLIFRKIYIIIHLRIFRKIYVFIILWIFRKIYVFITLCSEKRKE